jgi:hypothetical protein
VPLTVNLDVPSGVSVEVLTVSFAVPDVVEAGEKAHVAPAGNPVHARVTIPVNPLAALTVTV